MSVRELLMQRFRVQQRRKSACEMSRLEDENSSMQRTIFKLEEEKYILEEDFSKEHQARNIASPDENLTISELGTGVVFSPQREQSSSEGLYASTLEGLQKMLREAEETILQLRVQDNDKVGVMCSGGI